MSLSSSPVFYDSKKSIRTPAFLTKITTEFKISTKQKLLQMIINNVRNHPGSHYHPFLSSMIPGTRTSDMEQESEENLMESKIKKFEKMNMID